MLPRTFTGMVDDVFQNGWNRLNDEIQSFHTPVNIQETSLGYNLELVAPGLKKEDFKISTDRGLLNVSYEPKEEVKPNAETDKWVKIEYKAKAFKKSFTLNDETDTTQITARYQDGILMVFIPKKEKSAVEAKEIAVA